MYYYLNTYDIRLLKIYKNSDQEKMFIRPIFYLTELKNSLVG